MVPFHSKGQVMLNRFFLAILVSSSLSTLVAQAQTGIQWVDSVTTAKGIAAQQQRLVLMHFYSDDCAPCRRLESQVFPQSNVTQAMNRGYAAVKINTSKDPQLAKLYNVYTWPTDIVTDARGRELYRTNSPQDPNQYVQMLNSTLASYQAAMPYNPQIDSAPSLAQAPGNTLGAAAGQAGQYAQAATDQLSQTQQYAQHVAEQYRKVAADQAGQVQQYGQEYAQQFAQQAGQAAQNTAQGMQNRFAQAQQTASQYGQAAQQNIDQATAATQSQLQAAQQTASQYGQNLGLYGQDAASAVNSQAANLGQAAQQYGQSLSQYGQQATQSVMNGAQAAQQKAADVQQTAAQYAQYGAANGQAGSAAAQPPYTPAYGLDGHGASNQGAPTAQSQVQAPPYGQMTHNPYLNSAPNTPNAGQAQAAQATRTAQAPQTQPSPPATAPYGDLYANHGNASAAGAGGAPPISPAPAYEPEQKTRPLGIDGYCPVTLMSQKKWAKGDVRFGAVHRSRTYLFASEAEQQKFMADPDRYAPMLSGYDAVAYRKTGQLVEGSRKHGLTYMNHMFLFDSETALQEFAKSPQVFLGAVQQAMQAAPNRVVR